MLQLAALAAFPGWPPMAQIAHAQSYPSKPVRFMVGFPANGPNSILAGLAGDWLTAKLGQPFAVEHKPGQSGNIATAEVVRAPADGYTILLCGPANAIGASLYPNLPFNFLRDMVPVAGVTREPLVMVVHPAVPARTAAELIDHAKANPGKVKLAGIGNGTAPHVTGELFKLMTRLDLASVQYAGGAAALNSIIEGQTQMMFEPMSAAIEPIRTGKLRALAVTTATRMPDLPDVPTVADTVAGYEASQWYGFAAPKNTPTEIVDKLNKEINVAMADPGMKARLAAIGGETMPGSPADFGRLIADETEKWGKVVRTAGIKPE